MNRRHFMALLAAGLAAPMELARGRSQIAVPGFWTPTEVHRPLYLSPDTYDAWHAVLTKESFHACDVRYSRCSNNGSYKASR